MISNLFLDKADPEAKEGGDEEFDSEFAYEFDFPNYLDQLEGKKKEEIKKKVKVVTSFWIFPFASLSYTFIWSIPD